MFPDIEKWLRSRILQSKRPPTDVVVLVDVQPTPAVVDTFYFEPGADYEAQLQACLTQFEESVNAHAEQQGRSTKYLLELREGMRVIASRPFRMASTSNAVAVGETEAATPQGSLSLAMRMTESMHRTVMMQTAALNEKMCQMLDSMTARNAALEDRHRAMSEERAAYMAEHASERLELLKEEAKEARYTKIVEQAMPAIKVILPDVLGKLLAKDNPAPPLTISANDSGKPAEEPDSFKAGMIGLFKGLSDEQKEKLIETLTPEQVEKLLSLIGI